MTIPLILASKSKPRRDILFHAGIRPTIRVSHVDEDAVLARAAQEHGITVDGLPIDTKVMLLAEAKALAVYEAYLAVAKTAREARGERVTGRPLDAVTADDPAAALADDARAETQTRDFSSVRIPRTEEPLQQALADEGRGLTAAGVGPLILGCDSMFLLDGKAYGKPHTPEVARERLRRMSGAEGRGLTAAGVGPLILGCDSMFLLDGKAYGKPHTPEVARERLRRMSGATGELWTGHCLCDRRAVDGPLPA